MDTTALNFLCVWHLELLCGSPGTPVRQRTEARLPPSA